MTKYIHTCVHVRTVCLIFNRTAEKIQSGIHAPSLVQCTFFGSVLGSVTRLKCTETSHGSNYLVIT